MRRQESLQGNQSTAALSNAFQSSLAFRSKTLTRTTHLIKAVYIRKQKCRAVEVVEVVEVVLVMVAFAINHK